jgi:uncharacterized protein (DUF433 family)
MPAVRRALDALRQLDLALWTEEGGPAVVVDRTGEILIRDSGNEPYTIAGQRILDPDSINLIEPFATKDAKGPNLQAPRPNLRIVPGKLSGSPHIVKTRIETIAVASLADRGFDDETIHRLYPSVAPVAITEAIDLERQLAHNLGAAA